MRGDEQKERDETSEECSGDEMQGEIDVIE